MNEAVVTGDCKPGAGGCEDAVLDGPLAVGAVFSPRIHVDLPGSTVPAIHLESASPAVLAVEGDHLRAKSAGLSALLFVTDDGTVVDFLHVFTKAPSTLSLERIEDAGSLEAVTSGIDLVAGEGLRVRATPLGDGQALAGTLPSVWRVESAEVVELLADGRADQRRLLGRRPGRATVTVRAGELETSLEVVVHAAPPASLAMRGAR